MLGATLTFVASTPSFAQTGGKVTLELGSKGPRLAWIAPEPLTEAPTGVESESDTIVLAKPEAQPGEAVFIWDTRSGNLAVRKLEAILKPISDAPGVKSVRDGIGLSGLGVWKVRPGDYTRAYKIVVRVRYQGKPVASATLEVADKARKVSVLLSPKDLGEAAVYGMLLGPIRLSVQVKSGQRTVSLPVQTFDISAKRDNPEPVLIVEAPDKVETVGGVLGGGTSPESGRSAPGNSSGGFGSLVVYVAGIAAAAAVGYGILRYVQKNPQQVETGLAKLGVKIPDPPDATLDPLPASRPVPQAPSQILLEDSTPDTIPSVVAAASPADQVANPRFLADSGAVFLIQDGLSEVGRSAEAPIALENESSVSRRHAEVRLENGVAVLRDLGSTNGTYVNGVKIDIETPLQRGDMVQFGSIRLRYEA